MGFMQAVATASAVLVLCAGLCGSVLAEDDGVAGFTPVTGQRLTSEFDDAAVEAREDAGVHYMSGFVTRETWEWSDSRLPADMVNSISLADYQPADGWPGEVIYGTLLMEGPDGHWTGSMRLLADEDSIGHGMIVLTGHDAYEGLFGLLMAHTDDPDCIECEVFTGAIYAGAPPPMPGPLEPQAG